MFTKQVCAAIGMANFKAELPNMMSKTPSKTVCERQIRRLSARHHEIIELLLAGYRPRDIAETFEMGRQWLSVIMNSPVFLNELNRRLDQRFQEIGKMRDERAIDKLERELYFKFNLADAAAEAAEFLRRKKTDESEMEAKKRESKRLKPKLRGGL
jgi:hypothetical protein